MPGPGTPWSEAEADDEAGFRMLAVVADARSRGVGEALVRSVLDGEVQPGFTLRCFALVLER